MFKYILNDDLCGTIYKLLSVAIQLHGKKVAFWFYQGYPECNTSNVEKSLSSRTKMTVEKVTLYDDEKYGENLTFLLSGDTTESIVHKTLNQIDSLDSMAVYKDNAQDWFMALIFHENVCVLKGLNTDEENILAEHGFIVSDSPPEGW